MCISADRSTTLVVLNLLYLGSTRTALLTSAVLNLVRPYHYWYRHFIDGSTKFSCHMSKLPEKLWPHVHPHTRVDATTLVCLYCTVPGTVPRGTVLPVRYQYKLPVLTVLVGTSTSTAGTVRYRYYRYHRYFGHKSIQKPWAMPQLWYFTLATSPRICGTSTKITVLL